MSTKKREILMMDTIRNGSLAAVARQSIPPAQSKSRCVRVRWCLIIKYTYQVAAARASVSGIGLMLW